MTGVSCFQELQHELLCCSIKIISVSNVQHKGGGGLEKGHPKKRNVGQSQHLLGARGSSGEALFGVTNGGSLHDVPI